MKYKFFLLLTYPQLARLDVGLKKCGAEGNER